MNSISAARRARHLSLGDIAKRTRISLRFVEAIDEGRLAELPAGIYGRAYVRSVAAVVGVEGAELEEILAPLTPAPDPIPVLQEVHATQPEPATLRDQMRVHAAAGVDAAVLIAVDVAILEIVAAACGVSARTLMSQTPTPLLVLWAATWTVYFILFAGVKGSTPGQMACGISFGHVRPLRLGAIARRTLGMPEDSGSKAGGGARHAGLHSTADPASPA